MVKFLNNIFDLITQRKIIERIFFDLKQIKLASVYIIIFNYFLGRTRWNNNIKIYTFRQELKKNIFNKFIKFEKSIEDFDDFIKTIIVINDKLFLRKLKKQVRGFKKKKPDFF